MFTLLLTVALSSNPSAAPSQLTAPAISLFAQDPEGKKEGMDEDKSDEEKLDPKKVEAAVEALKEAFEKGSEVADRLEAIEAALAYPHEDIAKAMAKGLKDKEHEVVLTTIVALARLKHPAAMKELVNAYKRERAIKKDDVLFAATLKSIGSYGDPDNIDLLSDDLFQNTSKNVIRARIFGLGKTRSVEAAKELMTIMSSSGHKYVNPHMDEINLSLSILTGADEGKSRNRWVTWWNANKRTLKITEEPQEIDRKSQSKWDQYWDLEPKKKDERKKKDKREKPDEE
jgi:hypothetical protein